METPFGTLLDELGQILGIKLRPDHLNVCHILYPDGLSLQIEVDKEDRLLLACKIGTLPPGRFRQDFLEQTLKANTLDFHLGTFGYSKKTGELYLYAYMRLQNLTAKQVADFITPFIEKARHWSTSLASNTIPMLDFSALTKKASGMFGLAP